MWTDWTKAAAREILPNATPLIPTPTYPCVSGVALPCEMTGLKLLLKFMEFLECESFNGDSVVFRLSICPSDSLSTNLALKK